MTEQDAARIARDMEAGLEKALRDVDAVFRDMTVTDMCKEMHKAIEAGDGYAVSAWLTVIAATMMDAGSELSIVLLPLAAEVAERHVLLLEAGLPTALPPMPLDALLTKASNVDAVIAKRKAMLH